MDANIIIIFEKETYPPEENNLLKIITSVTSKLFHKRNTQKDKMLIEKMGYIFLLILSFKSEPNNTSSKIDMAIIISEEMLKKTERSNIYNLFK